MVILGKSKLKLKQPKKKKKKKKPDVFSHHLISSIHTVFHANDNKKPPNSK